MSKLLTIGEIEEMSVEALEKMLSLEQKEKLAKMEITTKQFLDNLKDEATLSGLEDDDEFVSISQHIAHIQEMDKIANEYQPDEKTIEQQYEDTESMKHELNAEFGKETTQVLATQNTTNNIMSFEDLRQNSQTQIKTYTNITDRKRLFNLDNTKPDYMLNDCLDVVIKVKGVYVNIYEKTLKEPLVNEKTGEIIKDVGDIVKTISCILVDTNGKTYATGSKTFTYQLFNYIQKWGLVDFENGLDIKIVKKQLPNSSNRALGFELVLE